MSYDYCFHFYYFLYIEISRVSKLVYSIVLAEFSRLASEIKKKENYERRFSLYLSLGQGYPDVYMDKLTSYFWRMFVYDIYHSIF